MRFFGDELGTVVFLARVLGGGGERWTWIGLLTRRLAWTIYTPSRYAAEVSLRYRLESFILDSTRMTCPALLPHDLYSVAALTILEYPKNKAQHFIH